MTRLPHARPPSIFGAYAFDLDGTIYLGEAALPGAVESVATLRRAGRPVVFVTNKPIFTAEDYATKLSRLGIPATRADVVTATDSFVAYLANAHGGATLLVVGEPLMHRTLAEAGFALTTEPRAADVVAVSFDRTFDYAKLEAAYRAIRLHGARLVASNPDPYCPTPEGGLPDCAAMLAAIEACTGAVAAAVTGKPSQQMADAVLERLGAGAAEVALVGDRLLTDMVMARRSGMHSVLVLTGATSLADVEAASDESRPDYVIPDLRDLLPDGALCNTGRGSAGEERAERSVRDG